MPSWEAAVDAETRDVGGADRFVAEEPEDEEAVELGTPPGSPPDSDADDEPGTLGALRGRLRGRDGG